MGKFIAVDCGKYETKVAVCDSKTSHYKEFKFRTRMDGLGRFDDDMLGRGTYVAQIDGAAPVRIGADATTETSKVSSKQDDMHRSATLLAIALCVNENEKEDVTVAIGIPYSICSDVESRNRYKDFILPHGVEHTVKVKKSATAEPVTVTFTVAKRYVYPESIGAMYEFPEYFQDVAGIIDMGNVNRGGTYINTKSISHGFSFTAEGGGNDLITSLADKLSVAMNGRVTYDLVAKVLKKPYEERHLNSKTGDKTAQEKSKKIIDEHLLDYVKEMKMLCDQKTWPLDFMNVIAIGGTSSLLERELKEVFGSSIIIPKDAEMINARGFLNKMCTDNNVDVEALKDSGKKKKEAKGAA